MSLRAVLVWRLGLRMLWVGGRLLLPRARWTLGISCGRGGLIQWSLSSRWVLAGRRGIRRGLLPTWLGRQRMGSRRMLGGRGWFPSWRRRLPRTCWVMVKARNRMAREVASVRSRCGRRRARRRVALVMRARTTQVWRWERGLPRASNGGLRG